VAGDTEREAGGLNARAMSNLKIYGIPLSRAYRALWMANELGLDYENVPIHFADGSAKTPEYLAVNPNEPDPCHR
jgi:glutathione S-transferase